MRILICVTAMLGLLATGCSNGPGAASGTVDEVSQQTLNDVSMNVQKVQQASDDAADAVAEAQGALAQITNENGSFKWSIIFKSDLDSSTAQSMTEAQFLTDGLAAKLSLILNKVVDKVKLAKVEIGKAKAALAAQIAKVPAGTPGYDNLVMLMAQLEQVEAQYTATVHMLASKINLIVAMINQLPGLANTFCPIPFVCGAAVYLVLNPIINAIVTFQAQLMSI